jgi:hypothetical protein
MLHSGPMAIREHSSPSRRRRHQDRIDRSDRHTLERAGWRTLLEYRENHVRTPNGRLMALVPEWIAEAEMNGDSPAVLMATAQSAGEAWAVLRARIEQGFGPI